jgi:hypothetical protein
LISFLTATIRCECDGLEVFWAGIHNRWPINGASWVPDFRHLRHPRNATYILISKGKMTR